MVVTVIYTTHTHTYVYKYTYIEPYNVKTAFFPT
jgi:hypothetical protein